MASKIGWTDEVWNPVSGCRKVSAGCQNCYAERIAVRYWGERRFTDIRMHEGRLTKPIQWQAPRLIFVNSMSDLFHAQVGFDYIDRVMATIARTINRHTYQVLTKRPERMLDYMIQEDRCRKAIVEQARLVDKKIPDCLTIPWPLPNMWVGVSVEDQLTADERIAMLLETPAAVRWVSLEPLLGPVDLLGYLQQYRVSKSGKVKKIGPEPGLDWVVIGGESGPGHRPMDMEWVASLVRQCKTFNVPVYVKQDSDRLPGRQGAIPAALWIKEYPHGYNSL